MICLRPFNAIPSPQIRSLSKRMEDYYRQTPSDYYAIADESRDKYDLPEMALHRHLLSYVRQGTTVCEVGCGTAHLCPQVCARGGHYTGVDWSPELLQANSRRFPQARFRAPSVTDEQYDVVASLYTLEHIAAPPDYLDQLWRLCRPGGLLAVICPCFVQPGVIAPSIFFGRTPRRLRAKIAAGALGDAMRHVWDLYIRVPLWQRRALAAAPGVFWINLAPRLLHADAYTIDADAVHLPRFEDLEWWFLSRGTIESTSRTLPDIPAEVLRFSMAFFVRKPR